MRPARAKAFTTSARQRSCCRRIGRPVRVIIFLLSGLFCCLGFSGVIFLLFGRERVFLQFGRGPRPRRNSKKKKTGGVFFFFCLGRWRFFFFFFAVWAGTCSFFCCLGRRRFFFAVWARACFFFFAVWAGGVFFLLFGRGTGVHSLTRLPGSSLSDPTTKETEQQNKKHGFLAVHDVFLSSYKHKPGGRPHRHDCYPRSGGRLRAEAKLNQKDAIWGFTKGLQRKWKQLQYSGLRASS